MSATRDELVPRVVYTHDSGLQVEVQPRMQQVIIPIKGENPEWLGPFRPYDIEDTCAAIGRYAKLHERSELLRAADDWRELNYDASAMEEGYGEHPKREKRHRFKWS